MLSRRKIKSKWKMLYSHAFDEVDLELSQGDPLRAKYALQIAGILYEKAYGRNSSEDPLIGLRWKLSWELNSRNVRESGEELLSKIREGNSPLESMNGLWLPGVRRKD